MTTTQTSHRVDVTPGAEHVVVVIDGVVVADSTRPQLVHETGLPVRYYLPREDVRLELFRASRTTTMCPYKGEASYWTYVDDEGNQRRDAVWSYQEPLESVAAIADHFSFYDTIADIRVS